MRTADIDPDLFSVFVPKHAPGQALRAVVRRAGGWSLGPDHAGGAPVYQNEVVTLKSLQDRLLRHGHTRLLEDGEKVAQCAECKRTFLADVLAVHGVRDHGRAA